MRFVSPWGALTKLRDRTVAVPNFASCCSDSTFYSTCQQFHCHSLHGSDLASITALHTCTRFREQALTFLSCRLDSEAKSLQLTEITEYKEGLESKLEQLNEAHSILTQQHEGLKADLTQVQASLGAAEEARASAEVVTPACAATFRQFLVYIHRPLSQFLSLMVNAATAI